MARTVVDCTWRDAAPDDIEPALAALWRDVGTRLPSARAVMSNLVVVRACASDEEFEDRQFPRDLPLDDVVARHPSRVIVLAHERGCTAAAPPIAARVAVWTFGPPSARYSVEEIAVRAACAEASIASIVRRLVRGDVPTSVWWADDLAEAAPLGSIVGGARQLIYDSRRWSRIGDAARALQRLAADDPRLDFADINWRRLTPIRQALAHVGDALTIEELRPAAVRIGHATAERPLAALLAGWLGVRLDWPAGAMPHLAALPAADDAVLRLTIDGDPAKTTIALTPDRMVVEQRGRPAYARAVARESAAEAIAAELRALAPDVPLRRTIERVAAIP